MKSNHLAARSYFCCSPSNVNQVLASRPTKDGAAFSFQTCSSVCVMPVSRGYFGPFGVDLELGQMLSAPKAGPSLGCLAAKLRFCGKLTRQKKGGPRPLAGKVGMSLDDIKKKKAQRPELRAAARDLDPPPPKKMEGPSRSRLSFWLPGCLTQDFWRHELKVGIRTLKIECFLPT